MSNEVDLKHVTVEARCSAQLDETWTFEVPASWTPDAFGDLYEAFNDLIEQHRLLDVHNEPDDEENRSIRRIDVAEATPPRSRYSCSECGTTTAVTYVVTTLDLADPDRTTTEVCRACDDKLRVPEGLIGRFDVPGYGEVSAYRSEKDDVLVVEIDTPEATEAAGTADGDLVPRARVYVNDGPVWEHPPYPHSD